MKKPVTVSYFIFGGEVLPILPAVELLWPKKYQTDTNPRDKARLDLNQKPNSGNLILSLRCDCKSTGFDPGHVEWSNGSHCHESLTRKVSFVEGKLGYLFQTIDCVCGRE